MRIVMLRVVITEFQKVKRYYILLIGIIGMTLSPILSLITQSVAIDEAKIKNFDFPALLNSTIWNNTTIFMPIIFTLIGGYLINREYTDDTLKNILVVPVSFRKLLTGKLVAVMFLAVASGVQCFAATLLAGCLADLGGINVLTLADGFLQVVGNSLCTCIVVLPVISFCGRRPGYYMGGAVTAFLLGYCGMFFKTGLLHDIYPFLAPLAVIRFDAKVFMNTTVDASFALGTASLCCMLFLTAVIVFLSKKPGTARRPAVRNRR